MRGMIAVGVLAVAVGLMVWLGASAWHALTVLPTKDDIQSASATVAETILPVPAAPASVLSEQGEVEAQEPARRGTVRFVEEDGIVGVRIDGPLERAPARLPPVEAPPPPKEEPDIYRLVIIESAGVINARSHKIRLAHVDAPPASLTCTRSDGSAWPCGRRARTALRRLIRRRAIECLDVKPVDESAAERPAVCTVGGVDLSRWLIEQGWATPTDTAPDLWRDLHSTAEAQERGLFAQTSR